MMAWPEIFKQDGTLISAIDTDEGEFAVLIKSSVLNECIWLCTSKSVAKKYLDSGLAVYTFDDIPHLLNQTEEALRFINMVKRVFPDADLGASLKKTFH